MGGGNGPTRTALNGEFFVQFMELCSGISDLAAELQKIYEREINVHNRHPSHHQFWKLKKESRWPGTLGVPPMWQ
jgi:hypothetical protein